MYSSVNPSFTILKWGVRGSSLHGHVFVMFCFVVAMCDLLHDVETIFHLTNCYTEHLKIIFEI